MPLSKEKDITLNHRQESHMKLYLFGGAEIDGVEFVRKEEAG